MVKIEQFAFEMLRGRVLQQKNLFQNEAAFLSSQLNATLLLLNSSTMAHLSANLLQKATTSEGAKKVEIW